MNEQNLCVGIEMRHRTHRRHQRNCNKRKSQRGGGGAAMLAPYGGNDSGYLLDSASRIQAGVGSLDQAFADIASVPRQSGGKRKHRSKHRKTRRHSRTSSRYRNRSQRGGMADYKAPAMLLNSSMYASDGTNPQFQDESTVNSLYQFNKGAQV